jgi:ribosomal protein S6--L-glutamate ligase
MILSFHPCVVTDENRICAGRPPDHQDLAAIRRSAAVVLPQGCTPALYRMVREHCRHVFPDYDARFAFPGKTGEIRLFRKYGAPHPETEIIADVAAFLSQLKQNPAGPLGFPYLIKLDWGGEGRTIFALRSADDLDRSLFDVLQSPGVQKSELLVQRFVPCGGRVLRVTVIGRQRLTYWRVAEDDRQPLAGLALGGRIQRDVNPGLQDAAVAVVDTFCDESGINLAGFDIIFPAKEEVPLFLEINYFFGREGLGGSAAFYQLLNDEIRRWIQELP